MATVPIGGVRVDLQLASAAFIRDIAKSNAAIAGFSRQTASSMTGLQRSIGNLTAGFAGFLTARTIRRVVSFTEECLKLATTIKGPLGTAAKDFQDNATRFENSFKLGVAQGFMDAVTQGLETANVSFEDLAKAGIILGNLLGRVFTEIVNFFTHDIPEGVKTSIESINSVISAFNSLVAARDAAALKPSALAPDADSGILGSTGSGVPAIPLIDTSKIESSVKAFVDLSDAANVATASLQTTAEGQRQMNAAAEAFSDLAKASNEAFESARTPLEKYAATVSRLNFLLKEGGINAETYGRLNVMAAANAVEPWLQVADTIGGALGTMFKDNKAFAIAQAVINTAQAITKSLAEYGFTPIGIAASVAAAAAGAAQIATIVSAQPGSSRGASLRGSGRKVKAVSDAGDSSTTSKPATTGKPGSQNVPGQAVNITLVGEGGFSREQVRSLIGQINEAVGDGAVIRVAR